MAKQELVPFMGLVELTSPEPEIRFPGRDGEVLTKQEEELANLNSGRTQN